MRDPSSGPARAPQRLGRYRLGRQLGAGGMGVVHEAVHEETGAKRAIKTLAAGDTELMLRFRREGQALAKVDHPNVMRVHSLGQESGLLYMVMDLAEGGSLADRLRLGPLPAREAAGLVRDLALGLAHVHARGILHRDLKPDNVLFDSGGAAKLTDFGLARIAEEGALTATGTVMGTPAYMAPEQADGQVASELADVYGLGAILYEALTGSPPFQGVSVLAILQQVLNTAPAAPRSLRPEIPPALEEVCQRALAKDPAKRPPSAAALAEALSTWEAAPKTRSAARALGIGGLGLLVLLASVAAWALWPAKRVAEPGPIAAGVPGTIPVREEPLPKVARPLGWQQVQPQEGDAWPAAREGHERGMAWIPGTGVVLFGGWDRRTPFEDLWVWNGRGWRELLRSESWPRGRYAHAMTYDVARGRLVLYGGIGGRNGGALRGEIWEWDGERWSVPSTPVLASRRFWHAMVDDPRAEGAFLFGGITSGSVSWGDLWRWDGRRFIATPQVDTSAGVPETRGQCGLVFDSEREVLVVYGGQRGVEGEGHAAFGDLWEWDGSSWYARDVGGRRGPGARTALGMVYARDRVVVFGGRFDDGQRPTETWSWAGSRWEELEAASPPPGRIWHGMVYDGDRDVIVVFGGNVGDQVQNDLWELDLSAGRKP